MTPLDTAPIWLVRSGKPLPLDRPRLLGILNITHDSFFAASRSTSVEAAAQNGLAMLAQGAAGLDVGGESTRPGAQPVPAAEQIDRIVPVIAALRRAAGEGPIITADTTSAKVARAAIEAGADAVNDVSAGRDDPAMLPLIASLGRGVILMHRLAAPAADSYSDRYGAPGEQSPPAYRDVVHVVGEFLARRAAEAIKAGIDPTSIVIDPGLGFGKTVEQNLELIARTGELAALGYPILSALSRKSFVGRFQGGAECDPPTPPEQRLPGTIQLSLRHVEAGARLLRVHDVGPHAAALASWAGSHRTDLPRAGSIPTRPRAGAT